ncbi:MAG: hypothetical protein IT331_10675 [Anaerolineae bacterium]|nr:hypothetical protein [Anaerolineae bacterium]
MALKVEHKYRFDAVGKLDSDDWLVIPREELRKDFLLDAALADRMVQRYFETIKRSSGPAINIISDAQGVRYLAPLGKTMIVFSEPERIADAQRAETNWQIVGGFLLAHGVSYGGRFYLGAEWLPDGALKSYVTLRRYPSRLISWFGINGGIAVYQRTQGIFHKWISETFLNDAAKQLLR